MAGHEGAHRAITPHPKELGLPQEKIRELYYQIGFGYLQNVIEDPAVNDWMTGRFPGLKEYTEKTYDEQLKEENAVLSTPEVQRIALQLGYWPKFSQYGSEVIRDWFSKSRLVIYTTTLEPILSKILAIEQGSLVRYKMNPECGTFWTKSLPRGEAKLLLPGRTFFRGNPDADFN